MILNNKTLECLRIIINEKSEYRSGPKLVQFFNTLGFKDTYGQGFPSRWLFTDEKLNQINGTPALDECIKNTFYPSNFIGRIQELDSLIQEFNQYLTFDKWKIVRNGAEIVFQKLDKIEVPPDAAIDLEDNFLNREFSNIDIAKLNLDPVLTNVLGQRIKEIENCYTSGAYLAVILLAGSSLEGILLGTATKNPRYFNSAKSSPKDSTSKVKLFHDWSLSNFIDVAKDLDLIQLDTHKFSHCLRDFRNYIHPYEQMSSGFFPREHTAKICLQVLKAAICEIGKSQTKLHS